METSQEGSHVKFVKEGEDKVFTAIVPRHREVRVGTLRSISRQAGLTEDEFGSLRALAVLTATNGNH